MKMNLDSTFDKLAKEAVDKAHEATRAYFSLRPEERTAAAANVVVRALKEADAPRQLYVQTLRMQAKISKKLAKVTKLKAWLEGKEPA